MYGKKNKIRISKHGFTLIELLIAMAIFSVVASVVYSSFRLGIISWRRIEANLSKYQRIRYAMNTITEDITNSFIHKDIKFKGGAKRMEFAGFLKETGEERRAIGKISYSLSGDALLRQQLAYWQAVREEFPEGGEELLSDVVDFNINYCYKSKDEEMDLSDLEWHTEWVSEEAIPAGIKLDLILKDEYSADGKIVFSKRIYIPVGEIGKLEELKE